MPDFQAQIRLPYVEKVHEVINAYLRTSLNGEWTVDPAHCADVFVMYFRRGLRKWTSYMGFGGHWKEHDYAYGWLVDRPSLPVFLKVVIRPSPQFTLLGLGFSARPVYPTVSGRSLKLVEKELGEVKQILGSIADAELNGLIDYLQEFYSLAEKPELILPVK